MGKNKKNKIDKAKKTTKGGKSISRKISLFFAIMLIISTLTAEMIVVFSCFNRIKDLIDTSLINQVDVEAGKINKELASTFYYVNGIADTVESIKFEDNDAINTYLEGTLQRYPLIPTGCYLALSDGSFVCPDDPSFGYDARSEAWYLEGMSYPNNWFYFWDVPYFDAITGDLCATVQRKVKLKDGREGVFLADFMMGTFQEQVDAIKLYDTGKAMIVTQGELVLSYEEKGFCGFTIDEILEAYPEYDFLDKIRTVLAEEDGVIHTISSGGDKYYVCTSTIVGTDWKVLIYVKQREVLAILYNIVIILGIFTVVAVIVVVLLITRILNKMIKKPVAELTGNIKNIADGDFTVQINSKGDDEIAFMNGAMGDFITGMRGTLKDIKDISENLRSEARVSRETADSLEGAAKEQSNSMEQVRLNVSNISGAVAEVADSATKLAQAIDEVNKGEQHIEQTMNDLVEKAGTGQKDMVSVANGMNDVVS
nr:methyl-accepting chemotaxis protein [Lachnospiraceae bacterium]